MFISFSEIPLAVTDYSPLFHQYEMAKNEEHRYKQYLQPSLWEIERRIHTATRMDDLLELIDFVRQKWTKKYGILDPPQKTDSNSTPAE